MTDLFNWDVDFGYRFHLTGMKTKVAARFMATATLPLVQLLLLLNRRSTSSSPTNNGPTGPEPPPKSKPLPGRVGFGADVPGVDEDGVGAPAAGVALARAGTIG
jgi:hypothetical protein